VAPPTRSDPKSRQNGGAWNAHYSLSEPQAGLCEHVFVREYAFTVTEHDPERPWIVRDRRHHTVMLEDGQSFFEWAYGEWPRERFTVELDPWQLTR
jgi:hypothetical protein